MTCRGMPGYATYPAKMNGLKAQGLKGVFSVEYEQNPKNPMPEVAESIDYFLWEAHWWTD